MKKPLISILLILIVFAVLIPAFIWINNRYNDDESNTH